MKRFVFILAAVATLSATAASAQNYMVVDSEKIFTSQSDYNTAITKLDNDEQTLRKSIEEAYDKLETVFNDYQSRKASMTTTQRQEREKAIIDSENKIAQIEKESFGEDGTMMKARVDALKPIQERVFAAIERYAKAQGFDIVLDVASNPAVLYYSPAVNRTDAVINALK